MDYFMLYCRCYTPRRMKNYGRKIFRPIDYNAEKEKEPLDVMQLLMYISLLVATVSLLAFVVNNYLFAARYATENTLTEQLISGTFDTREGNDINNAASNFFTKIASKVFSIALPFMSAFALTMITLSLVSSIIYLTKPDTFDEVHSLVQERKGNSGGKGLDNIVNLYRQKGLRDFALSYCIDFKSWAFQDSVTAGVDGEPTFQDLFRNMPKYIAMFTFCILITNRVLLDFLMTGAKLTASLAERITYDYDYVELMENFLDQGKRYTPQQWTGKGRENSNLMTTFRSIYNTVIANLAQEQKDTESLQAIGMKIEEYMMTNLLEKEHWDRKVFSARTEYIPVRTTTVDVPGTYYISGEELGMLTATGAPGFISLYIRSESDDTAMSASGTTRYPAAWSPKDGLPNEFNVTEIPGAPKIDSGVEYNIKASGAIAITADGDAYNLDISVNNAEGKINITILDSITKALGNREGDAADIKNRIRTITINGLSVEYKTKLPDQTFGGTKKVLQVDRPVWVNPAKIEPKKAETDKSK